MNDTTPNQPPRIMNDVIHPSVIAGLQWIKDQDSTRLDEPRLKVKITEHALYQRINRKLKHDGEQLRTARSQNVELSVGRYFTVNVAHNYIDRQHLDLEVLGRNLGVIQPWEQLEADTK